MSSNPSHAKGIDPDSFNKWRRIIEGNLTQPHPDAGHSDTGYQAHCLISAQLGQTPLPYGLYLQRLAAFETTNDSPSR